MLHAGVILCHPFSGIRSRILVHGRDLRIEQCLPLGLVCGAPWVSEAAVRTASGKHHHSHVCHVGHVDRDAARQVGKDSLEVSPGGSPDDPRSGPKRP